ncbi:hypothetical protein [Vibrio vulnificus]|uniref:hypothetical protein n=1 Tax=Vibrio vulnificus TaxID=672 RepID=UPI0030EF4481
MALLPICVGHFLFGFGLRYVDVHSANFLTSFEPLIATLLAPIRCPNQPISHPWLPLASPPPVPLS